VFCRFMNQINLNWLILSKRPRVAVAVVGAAPEQCRHVTTTVLTFGISQLVSP